MPVPLSSQIIQRAPKVLLHDHLDGGLRASTIVDLAAEVGYTGLPTTDVADLEAQIRTGADRKDLALYLETFAYTTGVMQEADALARVAAECAQDLAADGVVYAEIRFAPEQHLEAGLSLDEVVECVQEGFATGQAAAAANGQPIVIATLLSAMRQAAQSSDIASLAIRHRDNGVMGFDIAGPEIGFPPSRHLEAFNRVHDANFHTPPSTRGRRSASRPFTRRCSSAALSASVTGCASWTTSRCTPTVRVSWAGWPPSYETPVYLWRCVPPPTSIPGRPHRWPSTPLHCSRNCVSGSRSTPTTGS